MYPINPYRTVYLGEQDIEKQLCKYISLALLHPLHPKEHAYNQQYCVSLGPF